MSRVPGLDRYYADASEQPRCGSCDRPVGSHCTDGCDCIGHGDEDYS